MNFEALILIVIAIFITLVSSATAYERGVRAGRSEDYKAGKREGEAEYLSKFRQAEEERDLWKARYRQAREAAAWVVRDMTKEES